MEEEVKIPDDAEDAVILQDENGNLLRFQYLETVFCDDRVFDLLLPLDESDDDDGGVVILEVIGPDTEDPSYEPVTDDALCERVFAQFRKEFGSKYEFED